MASTGRLLDDWIEAYMVYTAESEAPDEYHAWVSLSTIAGVLRRRVHMNLGYFHLYPNLYIILVSPPGRCKKSTTMRIARPVLGEVPGINFSVDSTTRERFIVDMQQAYSDGQSAITIYSSEFGSILASSQMDMVLFLTDIYDCPPEWAHKTKVGGTNTIKQPFLNILAATTPDWMARAMPLDTVGIGLTSRIIFIYSETPRIRDWRPVLSKEQVELGRLLVRDLQDIATISGEYTMEQSADDMFSEWYKGPRHEESRYADARLSGYFERKPMHILKVAMVVAAAQRNEPIITHKDLVRAFAFLGHAERDMPSVFLGVGKNPLASDLHMALATVMNNPEGIPFGKLLDMFKHSVRKDELSEVLETLRMSGHITVEQTEDGPKYKPV